MSREKLEEQRTLIVLGALGMTVMVLLSLSSWVSAQSVAVVGSRKKVNEQYQSMRECSVAARLTDYNELVVVATCILNCENALAVAVSKDGGQHFTTEYYPHGVDPGAVVDPTTDRIWVSGLGGCFRCTSIAWRDPEDDTLSSDFYVAAQFNYGNFLDKPLMGVSTDGRHFLAHMFDDRQTCEKGAWAWYSDDPTDEQLWTSSRIEPANPVGCEFQGWGAKPVVLDDGRIVVVFRGYEAHYNNDLPVVVYSDDRGGTWDPDDTEPVAVAAESQIINVKPFNSTGAGDTPYAIDRRKCAPDIAVDRSTTPNDVYVAFYARAVRGDNSSGDRNSDIYISRSVDGGRSFPGGPGNPNLLQITDQMLGLTAGQDGPDQVMPSIAVDSCGGVNLVFYDNRNDPDRTDGTHILDVYFVRITDYGNGNNIQQERLTPNPFTLPSGEGDFLGDYHHMALAGSRPTLYPAWIAMHGNNPSYQYCYINKISILCYTELSSYIAEQEDSCELFERLYKEGTIDGDLNGDGFVDHEDEEIFAALVEGMKE